MAPEDAAVELCLLFLVRKRFRIGTIYLAHRVRGARAVFDKEAELMTRNLLVNFRLAAISEPAALGLFGVVSL